ncbi:MAG: cytochrome c peroxidase [Methylococcales bacterium]
MFVYSKINLLPISLLTLCLLQVNNAAEAAASGPIPINLSTLTVPPTPGLVDGTDPIVIDLQKAIILGKALFWDTNVGSDGMACASCHFHAGADVRVKNQISPGGKSTQAQAQLFDSSASGALINANHTLKKADFPFYQLQQPLDNTSPTIHNSDDVVSSAGSFGGQFNGTDPYGSPVDECQRTSDPVFHVGGTGTRRVQPRNTPTVINAVFNHRNFWDGRANNIFNGSSPWGDRDTNAGVWVKINGRKVIKQTLHLVNASLASQALAPPLNNTEMSCLGRVFPDLGRKLLQKTPLQHQKVHFQDSVLGDLSYSAPGDLQPGLNTTYGELIRSAFNRKYWSYRRRGPFGSPSNQLPYTQIEANFSMFFGLAIQLYESTLISDQSRFDLSARDQTGMPTQLTASEMNGLEQFRLNQCALCHIGPNFTAASISANAAIAKTYTEAFGDTSVSMSTTNNVVNRILTASSVAMFDSGFASTGVTDTTSDIGVGGTDPFGNPLSFSLQYLQHLTGNNAAVVDSDVFNVRSCDFQEAFAVNVTFTFPITKFFTANDGLIPQPQNTIDCYLQVSNAFLPSPTTALAELNNPNSLKMTTAVNGAFKIPSLRNIELTGPYMHNGGMESLEQVIEFYARGGNFNPPAKQSEKVFSLAPLTFDINAAQNRADLIAFLKTLTDDRVKYEKAPFDHPEIKIPHGHVGDEFSVASGNPIAGASDLAEDEFLTINAVGASGRSTPLKAFDSLLAP